MNPFLFCRAKLVITWFLAFAFASPVLADLHKCVDKQNRTYYQDRPCQAMTAERLPSSLLTLGAKEEARAFFWKGSNGKSVVYLLGSLHFGSQSSFSLPKMIADAFNVSDVLVVEADIEAISGKEMANAVQGKGRYTDNSKLENHIKLGTWKATVEKADKLGFDQEALHPLKPWLAALMLNAQSLQLQGYSTDFSVDKLLTQQAQGKKPVIELESVEAQVDLIDQFTEQEQEQMLLHTLKNLSDGSGNLKANVNAWKDGDLEAMDLIVRQSFDSGQTGSKLYKFFLTDRNERMANSIMDLAKDGRTYLVVLGADHLGGDKGILKLLEQKGYVISQP